MSIANTIELSQSRQADLERRLRGVVHQVSVRLPEIHWEYDVHGTEYFPFRAYASAMDGTAPDANEIVVLCIQCHRPGGLRGGVLVFNADISRENGLLLSDSPRIELVLDRYDQSDNGAASHRTLSRGMSVSVESDLEDATTSAISSLERWLGDQVPVIERELVSATARDARVDSQQTELER